MTPDGFPKRPLSMKSQRWKHIDVEEEKRVGEVYVRNGGGDGWYL